MYKKVISLIVILSLVLTLGLTGCGGSKPADSKSSAPAPSAPAATSNSSKKIILRAGHLNAPGSTADKGLLRFKELLEKKSNGAIEVQVFANAQLGDEKDMLNLMQMGSLEMLVTGDGMISIFLPQYGAVTMPFIFNDAEHMLRVFENPSILKQINDDFIKVKGSRLIDTWTRGPRNLTNNKKIEKLADLKGSKLRVPEMTTYVEAWKLLGALPTPMSLTELYSAMQQGVVSGQENPYDLIYTSSFFEVQKYVMKTQHVFGPYMVLLADKFFQGLSPELQKAVIESSKEAGVITNKETAADQEKLEKQLKDKGMQIIEVNRQEWKDALKDLPAKLETQLKWKPGFYDEVKKIK